MRVLLGMAGLTVLYLFCGTGSAQPKDAAAAKIALRDVAGFGSSEASAKKDAVKRAAEAINKAMAAQEPPLRSFVVTEAYVISKLVNEPGRAGKEVKEIINGKEEVSKEWILSLRTDTDWWSDLVRRNHEAERKVRAGDRQTIGAQVIIGLACLLLAGFGYVQLDEYTQRRYTSWLRIAGVGVATSVVAVWWWTFISG